jgi:hypothetical protein
MRTDNLTKNLMAERGDGRLARRQTMLREKFRNRAIRRSLLAEFDDDFFRREQILEFLWTARSKFRDGLPDCGWVK